MPRGIYRGRRPFGKYSDLLRRPTGRPVGQQPIPRPPGYTPEQPTPAPRRPLPPKPHPGYGSPGGGTPPPVMGTSWLSGQKPPMLPRGQRPAFKRGVPVDIMRVSSDTEWRTPTEEEEFTSPPAYEPQVPSGGGYTPPEEEEPEEEEKEKEKEKEKDPKYGDPVWTPVPPETPTSTTPETPSEPHDVRGIYGFPPMEDSPKGLDIWQQQLANPLLIKTGLSGRERQGIYNLQRRQTQGATAAAAERMREMMGGKGFRMGESGRADTAVGGIISGGAERMGKFAQEQALTERQLRFKEAGILSGLNLQRMGTGMQGQVGLEGIRADRYRTAAQERLGVAGLEWDVSKFGQGLDWDKQRYGMGLDWDKERFGMGLDWDKERYGSEFGYRSQYDALQRMMDMYRMMYGSQEGAWDRYADQYGRQTGGY